MTNKRVDDYIAESCIEVPINKVDLDETNIRRHYTKKELVSLGRSIAINGQIEPCLVEKTGNRYRLVYGNRRYLSKLLALQMGWTSEQDSTLLVNIARKLPEDLRLKIQSAENECKEKVPSERVADSLWGRYQIMLAEIFRQEGKEKEEEYQKYIDIIHKAKSFWQIPKEVRKRLTIRDYARIMGRAPSTVSAAFHYETVSSDIKRKVRRNALSYVSACQLARIFDEENPDTKTWYKEQEKVLDSVPENQTERTVRKAVKKYLNSSKIGEFSLRTQPDSSSRSRAMKELSFTISRAERTARVLEAILDFDSSVLELGIYNDGKVRIRDVLCDSYKSLRKFNEELKQDDIYLRRWNHFQDYLSRASPLESLLARLSAKEGKERKQLMSLAKLSKLSVSKIGANPLNPRGKEFDEEGQEKLAKSISDLRLLQIVVVMKSGDKYVCLAGHRRIDAIKRNTNITYVQARILPELTEDEQLTLMYEEDIFEEVSLHDRALGIARQFKLDRKVRRGEYTLDDFCRDNSEKWPRQLIRDAVLYDSLPEEVKTLYQEGLISYRVAVDIATAKDINRADLARSAAIFRTSHYDIRRNLNDKNQPGLISEQAMAEIEREGERRQLIRDLEEVFSSLIDRTKMDESKRKKLIKDYDLMHKFQAFYISLEELCREHKLAK